MSPAITLVMISRSGKCMSMSNWISDTAHRLPAKRATVR